MKILRRLPLKIIIFILAVVTFSAFVASVVVGAVMLNMGFYQKTVERILIDESSQYMFQQGYQIINTYRETGNIGGYETYNTNLRFLITDKQGKKLAANITDIAGTEEQNWQFITGFKTQKDNYGNTYISIDGENSDYILYAYIDGSFPVRDEYYDVNSRINILMPFKNTIIYIEAITLVIFILFLVLLMCVSARRADTNEILPGKLHKVPFDLFLLISGFTVWFIDYVVLCWINRIDLLSVSLIAILILFSACALMGIFMSVAGRVKTKTLISNNVIYKLINLTSKIVKYIASKITLIWKLGLITVGLAAVDFFLIILAYDGLTAFALVLFTIKSLAFIAAVLYIGAVMTRLKKSAEVLASGNLNYKTDTTFMISDFKKHGENLNSISAGMSRAIENKLKSERLRTELITNVSHDIKNPLTSIINYSNLIAEEECNSKKHKEYSTILVSKSEHLKRLLEDLIEMSKASTGNMPIELMPLDAGVLLDQIYGEFEERCEAAGLKLIIKKPEEQVMISADNRKIWRIFENLIGNACKYSLTGSRIYLNLEADNGTAVISVRNTSGEPLDISPDELMERFVRADSSRSTEGNGLGLSIARSLTEIQGGTMDVSIDGDLFKVTLIFKTA